MIKLPTTPGGWPCIVADPPWRFSDRGHRMAPDQRSKRLRRRGYRTMSMEQLLAMPVASVASPNALLFMWTTDSHLVDGSAQRLAEAWGFEPKRTWTWVKAAPPAVNLRRALADVAGWMVHQGHCLDATRLLKLVEASDRDLHLGPLGFGGGHYVRTADEKVLICRRGRAAFKVHDERSVFFAPRRVGGTGEIHSTKPHELFAKVERVCDGPRLELFAREPRSGWSVWGDESNARRAA